MDITNFREIIETNILNVGAQVDIYFNEELARDSFSYKKEELGRDSFGYKLNFDVRKDINHNCVVKSVLGLVELQGLVG